MGNYSFVEYVIDSDPEHPRMSVMYLWKEEEDEKK